MEGCHSGVLTPYMGFHKWYLSQMPDDVKERVETFLQKVESTYENVIKECSEYEAQYMVPMGYKLQTYMKGDLRQMAYMTELRSGLTVHPTARFTAVGVGMAINKHMEDHFGLEQVCRLNLEDDTLTVKRGQQNIDGVNDL
jgi:Thymidylate synthase complementing protein.